MSLLQAGPYARSRFYYTALASSHVIFHALKRGRKRERGETDKFYDFRTRRGPLQPATRDELSINRNCRLGGRSWLSSYRESSSRHYFLSPSSQPRVYWLRGFLSGVLGKWLGPSFIFGFTLARPVKTARIINSFANSVILSHNCHTRGQHLSCIPRSAKIIETNLLTVAG